MRKVNGIMYGERIKKRIKSNLIEERIDVEKKMRDKEKIKTGRIRSVCIV